jgi:hypothetical protein
MFAGQTVFSRANKPAASCLQGKRFKPRQKYQPLYVCRANDSSQGKNTNPFMFVGQTILARAKIPTPLWCFAGHTILGRVNKPAALCLQGRQF